MTQINNQVTPSLTPMGENNSVKETTGEMKGQPVTIIDNGEAQAIMTHSSVEDTRLTLETNTELGNKESVVMDKNEEEVAKFMDKQLSEYSKSEKNDKVPTKTQLQQNISNKTSANELMKTTLNPSSNSSDAKMVELSKVHKETVEVINKLKVDIQSGSLNAEIDKFWNDFAAEPVKLNADIDKFWDDFLAGSNGNNAEIDTFWNDFAAEPNVKLDAAWDDFVETRYMNAIDGNDLMLSEKQMDETDFLLNPSDELKSTKVYKERTVVALLDKLIIKLDSIINDADKQKDSSWLQKSIDAIIAIRNMLAHADSGKLSDSVSFSNLSFGNDEIGRSKVFINPSFDNDEIDIDPNDNINTKLAYDEDDLESTDM